MADWWIDTLNPGEGTGLGQNRYRHRHERDSSEHSTTMETPSGYSPNTQRAGAYDPDITVTCDACGAQLKRDDRITTGI
jgi:hypothetical protein